ncbi:MAG: S26 family signal peptidase [Candidatus Aenigmarchaeota archaeon]|nr:S26 family signal peptidase [Candidatus Aenigmarchaeota archaeon]MCX8190745.1 S26 family signal peptidase [Candidatus Aenigmarchaeota archaeon]MDW8159993.1 S26 family signal peptidase [Candidatus Aenigmarchaeota archaeon]
MTKPLEDGRIPNDKLLVLGEDVRDSFDSRFFGYISKDRLIGKIIPMEK